MANTIRLKSGSGSDPSASDLVVGEVALRTDGNPKLFTKNDAGSVLEVGLGSLNDKLPLTGGTLTGNLTLDKSGTANITIKSSNDYGTIEVGGSTGAFIDLKSPATDDYDTRFTHDGFIYAKNNITLSPTSGNVVNVARNLNAQEGLDVTGDITCTSDLTLDSTNTDYPRITLHSNATGIRKYAIINGQGWNQDALLIYDIDGDNTRLTIEPNGLGINRGANSISHGLDVGGTAMIRGNTEIRGNILLSGDATTTSQERTIDFTGFDKESTSDFSDRAYIRHTTNTGGLTGSVLLISSGNDSNDGIALSTNNHNSSLRLNSNIIWNAGNDGSGSGLDSDTLDGIQGSSFLRSDANDTASGAITFSGAITTSRELTFSSDSDGIFLFGGGRFYKKSGTGVMVRLHEANTPLQVENNSGTVLGTFWHSGNDGAGTGLDADLLDGVGGASYLRSDANDNVGGVLTFVSGGLDLATNNISAGMRIINNGNPSSDGMYIGYGNANSGATRVFGGGATSNGISVVGSGNNDVKIAGNTVFHAGNDGSGSGLDADTLDGFGSGQFLRSDTTDTATGAISFQNINLELSGHWFNRYYDASNRQNYIHLYPADPNNNAGNAASQTDIRAWTGSTFKVLQINGGSNDITWGGHKMWNAANDGSGSNLDADKLDGQDGSYYTNAANLTGTLPALDGSNLTGLTVNNANTLDNLDSSQFLRSDAVDSSSANITINGLEIGSWVLGSTYRGIFHTSQSGSEYMIISQDDNTFISATTNHKVYIRNGGNDATNQLVVGGGNDALTWRGNKVFHAGNDGSGSGLDSDTVDGIQGGSFLRGDVDDTTVGHLTFNRSVDAKFALSGSNNPFFILNEGTTQKARFQWSESGYVWIQNHEDNSVIVLRDNFGFSPDAGSTIHSIFHAGNDGSGSNLDADTLDGVQGSSYLRSDASDTFTGTLTYGGNGTALNFSSTSEIILADHSSNSTPVAFDIRKSGNTMSNSTTYGVLHLTRTNHNNSTTNAGAALHFRLKDSGGNLREYAGISGQKTEAGAAGGQLEFYRYARNVLGYWNASGLYIGGNKVFHAGNDGSGSGLDADTVDSLNASQFLRSDANDTMSGNLTVSGTGSFSGKVDFQGDAAIEGGSGYGVFKGYTSNDNHFITSRGIVANQSTLSITGGHQMTFVEHASGTTDGWYFKSKASGSYAEKARIDGTSQMYLGGYKVFHQGNDGSGSGLDADTLDGVQGSSYLRSDADDSFSGILTNNSRNEDPSVTAGCINLQPSTSGGRTGIIFRSKVNHTSDHAYIWYFDDLDTYRTSGNSSENGVLLLGIQNDAANAVSSDNIAIEASGDIFLNPGILTGKKGANSHNSTAGNLYIGNATTNYKVFHAGAHSLPDSDNAYDLGSSAKRFRFIYTTDIQLSNENTGGNEVDGTEGTWTLQEGEDDIYMINRKNGKRYKIKMEEV